MVYGGAYGTCVGADVLSPPTPASPPVINTTARLGTVLFTLCTIQYPNQNGSELGLRNCKTQGASKTQFCKPLLFAGSWQRGNGKRTIAGCYSSLPRSHFGYSPSLMVKAENHRYNIAVRISAVSRKSASIRPRKRLYLCKEGVETPLRPLLRPFHVFASQLNFLK